jgi:hypothetical protein
VCVITSTQGYLLIELILQALVLGFVRFLLKINKIIHMPLTHCH